MYWSSLKHGFIALSVTLKLFPADLKSFEKTGALEVEGSQ